MEVASGARLWRLAQQIPLRRVGRNGSRISCRTGSFRDATCHPLSVRTGDYDEIAVGIPQPALPVIGATLLLGRITMPRPDDLDTHLDGTLHNRFKVVHLKPQ